MKKIVITVILLLVSACSTNQYDAQIQSDYYDAVAKVGTGQNQKENNTIIMECANGCKFERFIYNSPTRQRAALNITRAKTSSETIAETLKVYSHPIENIFTTVGTSWLWKSALQSTVKNSGSGNTNISSSTVVNGDDNSLSPSTTLSKPVSGDTTRNIIDSYNPTDSHASTADPVIVRPEVVNPEVVNPEIVRPEIIN